MTNEPFINGRTLGDTCALLQYNKMNVRQTEKDLGVERGTLDRKIKSKKYLPYFTQRYPKRYPKTTEIIGTVVDDMSFKMVECMKDGCTNLVKVPCMPGEDLPRGFRKWCSVHKDWAGEQTAGCFNMEGGSGSRDEQMGSWQK